MGYNSRQNTKSSNVFSEGGGAVKEMEIFSQLYNIIDKRQILQTWMCKQSTKVGCVLPVCPHRSALIATTDVAWGGGVSSGEQVWTDL